LGSCLTISSIYAIKDCTAVLEIYAKGAGYIKLDNF